MALKPSAISAIDQVHTSDAVTTVQGDNLQGERIQNPEVIKLHQQMEANNRAMQEILSGALFAMNDSGLAHLVLAGWPEQYKDKQTHPLYAQVSEKYV